jgi:SNF2 family DNA or RNA helicase
MSFSERDECIKNFQDNEEIRVMIASFKVGGVGLNLIMANKCILVDHWWNDAMEKQVRIIKSLL